MSTDLLVAKVNAAAAMLTASAAELQVTPDGSPWRDAVLQDINYHRSQLKESVEALARQASR